MVDALRALASTNHTVNYNSVASLSWLVYDMFLSFDSELVYIWRAKWTLPKVLYVFLRFYAPLWLMYECIVHLTPGRLLSDFTCKTWPPLHVIGPVVVWIAVDCIVILRLRALYHNDQKTTIFLLTTWLCAAAVNIILSIYSIRAVHPIPAPPTLSYIAGCLVLDMDWEKARLSRYMLVASLLLNMLFITMTVLHAVRYRKQAPIGGIYTVLLKEGAAYFVVAILVNIADLVFVSGNPSLFAYLDVAQFWLTGFYSYAGCHLILHLREKSCAKPTSFADMTEMHFTDAVGPRRSQPAFHTTSTSLEEVP